MNPLTLLMCNNVQLVKTLADDVTVWAAQNGLVSKRDRNTYRMDGTITGLCSFLCVECPNTLSCLSALFALICCNGPAGGILQSVISCRAQLVVDTLPAVFTHAPVSLLPTPFPRDQFNQAYRLADVVGARGRRM